MASAPCGGNIVVQIAGNGNTVRFPDLPHLELTLYDQRRTVREDNGAPSAADLVSAYTRSIAVTGREAVLADLWAWLNNGTPISIRVLVGSAGRGKTRLALQLCEEARAKGWASGFLTTAELERFRHKQNPRSWGWSTPLLVVVDYVASQAELIHDWLVELADNPVRGDPETGTKRPLRLLLLERQADTRGGWWRDAFGRGGGGARAVQSLLDRPEPIVLPAIEDREARRRIIAAIVERGGSQLRPPPAGQSAEFDRKLAELSWGGEPLFLMMAGLTAAKLGFDKALALTRDDLAFDIADHELARIGRIARAHDVGEDFAIHMAAVTTLCQGLSRDAAYQAIDREKVALGHDDGGDRATIYGALREALAHEQGVLEPIVPDMIGEAVLLRAWGGDAGTPAVLRAAQTMREAVAKTVIRTCQDFAIHGHAAPLAWLDALGGEAARDLPALLELMVALPKLTLELRERAAALTQTAVDALRSFAEQRGDEQDKALLAAALNNLSNRLSDLGRREAALAAVEEAVALYRALAAARPDAFRPALATSLTNLSNHLSALGRREAALAASEEAVTLYRDLAATRPEAFRPDLASSLNNLSNRLADIGRQEEALATAEEAAVLYGELAAGRPDAYRPYLAVSLNNLSNRLSSLGRNEAALAAIDEAVAIRRELAAMRADAFRPDLAASLNNLSNHMADLGRRDGALAAVEEAVMIYRELAAVRPDAFQPDLAMALNNFSNHLADLGHHNEALAAAAEAVSLYRNLAAMRPDAFGPDLAMSLNNYSNHLADLRRHEEAFAAGEEAVSLYRKLASVRPHAFQPALAASINNLSIHSSRLGRLEEAAARAEEAIALYRGLAKNRPDVYEPKLAQSFGALGDILYGANRRDEAAAAFAKGLMAIRRSLEQAPAQYAPLAVALLRDHIQNAHRPGNPADETALAPIIHALVNIGAVSLEDS